MGNHIQKVLPELRNQIRRKIKEKKVEVQQLGQPIAQDKASQVIWTYFWVFSNIELQGWLLLHLLNRFSEQFKAAIDGVPSDINTNELYDFSSSFLEISKKNIGTEVLVYYIFSMKVLLRI